MDVSFDIPRAGPLSQISAHVISFDTAVWLATGAIGWWKARERSSSLTETLSARKTCLVSTSSFNYAAYREARKQGSVIGLTAQRGALRRLTKGPESTAVTHEPAIDCLRALATGLLCFYSETLTSTILADTIQYGLLHSEQEDSGFEFDGPAFASLNDWVRAVAAEEDCNNFRQRLLQKSSRDCQDLIGSHVMQVDDEGGYNELGLLLGCLRWMVTPLHRRKLLKYPTRSIRVWTTMSVMSQLGFSVSMSLNVVKSQEQYIAALQHPFPDDYPDVVLVTLAVGKTDHEMVMEDTYQYLTIRPQITPLLSIPYAAFGRLQRQYQFLNAADLTDIWKICFRYAKDGVTRPSLGPGGKVHLKANKECAVLSENHKLLIGGLWSPHLARILRPAFDSYVPKQLHGDWSLGSLKGLHERQASGESIQKEDIEVMKNDCTLKAIILGTIYGACSVALTAQVSQDPEDQLGDETIEVAFSPDFMFGNRFLAWASTLGLALSGLVEHSGWVGLLLELANGMEHPQPLDEQPTVGILHQKLKGGDNSVIDKSHVRITDVMGAQANGVFVVSQFVLRPSSDVATSLIFHVGAGRILDVPVDHTGYVRSSQQRVASTELILNPEPEMDCLSLEAPPDGVQYVRIDTEPYWRGDPQTICFAVRNGGVLIATLAIPQVIEKLLNCSVKCECGNPTSTVSVPLSERWQNVTVYQLQRSGIPGAAKSSVSVGDRDKILINVAGNDACRVYLAGLLACRRLVFCKDCVSCALNASRKTRRVTATSFHAQSTALVMG